MLKILTGGIPKEGFQIITGVKEVRSGERVGNLKEAKALAKVNPSVMASSEIESVVKTIEVIAKDLGWAGIPEKNIDLELRKYVCEQLTGFGPLELLIKNCAGNAVHFTELTEQLFPDSDPFERSAATDGLLALGNYARRTEKGRHEQPLLPTRVHLLFRGLSKIYSCVNSSCDAKRAEHSDNSLLGKLYTEPRIHCECGARVYELLTHRDCGAAFLRAYSSGTSADFLWHERGGKLSEFGEPLLEIHFLIDEPHRNEGDNYEPIYLDIFTGRTFRTLSEVQPRFKLILRPRLDSNIEGGVVSFSTCPACTRRTRSALSHELKIMDLATKGEQPFANLIREQFVCQLPTKPLSEQHPNQGKKALLFSDGRQKAARLARDLPREVERDSIREALVLAIDRLNKLSKEATLDEALYSAFLSICSDNYLNFFDGHDQRKLLEDCSRFKRDYDADLRLAFDSDWKPIPSIRYRQTLLREMGDPYYSLVAACAVIVEPRSSKVRLMEKRLSGLLDPESINNVTKAWIREMLEERAFDPDISKNSRLDEYNFFNPVRLNEGLKKFFKNWKSRLALDDSSTEKIRHELFDVFTVEGTFNDDSGRLLKTDGLFLKLALNETWFQCKYCRNIQLEPKDFCLNCFETKMEPRPPEHPYMAARKGFFREPLLSVLRGERPIHITAEEHTAQLSHRDTGIVYASTEEFELRFQDVPLGQGKPPVDILSCTTTMEVGIDIGALTAVGLRTVPPQRENYQQRAGRAGRRGTSVSTVLTFAQGGAHDAFYFKNPALLISGNPRNPRININNRRLARRHIHSHLIQTFFHDHIDNLPLAEQNDLKITRPGIMNALGKVRDFFYEKDFFSFEEFDAWLQVEVMIPTGRVTDQISSWLPTELFSGSGSVKNGQEFVREVAQDLRTTLRNIKSTIALNDNDEKSENNQSDDDEDLLDVLFDQGVLPTYAFPTDLCSFVIQEYSDNGEVKVKERPQHSKAHALSEYAPGRLLVVNKKTYRVGGIFIDGRSTGSPASVLFENALGRYIGCKHCTYVKVEDGKVQSPTPDGTPCPVCNNPLVVSEFLDPPAFSPESGRAVSEGDSDQEITYASAAQLPEIIGRDEFEWHSAPGKHLSLAYGEDVKLIIANKGKDGTGFSICESCGAAWLSGEEPLGNHDRPFLLPSWIRAREKINSTCKGTIRRRIFLSHAFKTDLLLLRIEYKTPLNFSPKQPWTYDALSTLAEALCLGASLRLDIDPGELSAGFRLLPNFGNDEGVVEIFLYDTASGGAGYSADAGADLEGVLAQTRELLENCPSNCEKSCTKCIRHYGNRFLHGRFDRRLALQLLDYILKGDEPKIEGLTEQNIKISPLLRYLELEGWEIDRTKQAETGIVVSNKDGKKARLGCFPALLNLEHAKQKNQHSKLDNTVLLEDYLIDRDLPAAYQSLNRRMYKSKASGSETSEKNTFKEKKIVELDIKNLRDLGSSQESTIGRIKVSVEAVVGDSFVCRVPTNSLSELGFKASAWLVLKKNDDLDIDGQNIFVIQKKHGKFKATDDTWTIAVVKKMDDGTGRMTLTYSRPESRFRPERFNSHEIQLVAKLIEITDMASL